MKEEESVQMAVKDDFERAKLLLLLCNNIGCFGSLSLLSRSCITVDLCWSSAVGFGSLRTFAADVTWLTAAIAGLAFGGAPISRCAVARNVSTLTTCIALCRLSMAIASKVIRTTALVAATTLSSTTRALSSTTRALSSATRRAS